MKRPKIAMEFERHQAAICGVNRQVYKLLKANNLSFNAQPLLAMKDCIKRLSIGRRSVYNLLKQFAENGLVILRTGNKPKSHIYVYETQFNDYLEAYRESVVNNA